MSIAENFETPEKEIADLKKKLEECLSEFQEFRDWSRDLEAEYDTQIKQLDKKNAESVIQINRLESENEQLKSRHNSYLNNTQQKLLEYQQQLAEMKEINFKLTTYIREIEQNNDDLERAKRTLTASLEDLEAQLNQQIEKNVLSENELNEKDELECLVQRLKEEIRDLQQELKVIKNSNPQQMGGDIQEQQADSSIDEQLISDKTDISAHHNINCESKNTHNTRLNEQVISNGIVIDKQVYEDQELDSHRPKSSSGISAIGLVTELLKRLGALENKLGTARKVP